VAEPVASRQIQLASKDKLKIPQPESLVLVLRGHVGTNEIGKIEEGLFFFNMRLEMEVRSVERRPFDGFRMIILNESVARSATL